MSLPASVPPLPPLAPPPPSPFDAPAALGRPCPLHLGDPLVGACPRCGRFICAQCVPDAASKSPGLCADCLVSLHDLRAQGIRGWLLFVAIRLGVAVVGHALFVLGFLAILANGEKDAKDTPSMILAEAAMFVASGVAFLTLLTKAKIARGALIAHQIVALIFYTLSTVVLAVGAADEGSLGFEVIALIGAVSSACVWIPYYVGSIRVRNTLRPEWWKTA